MSRVPMSEAEFQQLLFARRALRSDTAGPGVEDRTAKPVVKRSRRKPSDLPENQVAAQVCGFLRAKGWIVTRQQSGLFSRPYDANSRIAVGERGCADWRAEKPVFDEGVTPGGTARYHSLFYFELKSPGKKPRPDQLAWLESRRRTGTEARWFDSFDGGGDSTFLPWYRRNFK